MGLLLYKITMEKVCHREENLLYFRDQVAYSQQVHGKTSSRSSTIKTIRFPRLAY